MFSSLLNFIFESAPHLSDSSSSSRASHNVNTAPSATSKPLERSGDTIVTLPHAESWTETPPQTQAMPGLNFRFELVESTECRCQEKIVVHPPCREDDVPLNSSDNVSGSPGSNPSVFLNLRTLGLDSLLPHDARDFTVAAVNLGLASRARAEDLEKLDHAIEDLRVLVDSFNESNNGVALSASLYEAVRLCHSRPRITKVMWDLVNALHPLEDVQASRV
ncbi:hypothetical protein BKA70DRAFT_1441753 [Coprinopsis sp. MPI-PUGE-AT-0042]|nr:hypothetical protein BKA70DRAFT_1441753 [Coprinopsis sp. MPI-PUGE-AT-0042]